MTEDLLYCIDLYNLTRLKEKPFGVEEEEQKVQHRKAIAYIKRWMDTNLHEHISNEIKADVVWKKLENLFAKRKHQETRLS